MLRWDDLFLQGSIVDLSTSKWWARTRITPADLGIADSDAVAKALALGNHRLVPADAFKEIDAVINQAKRSIEHYSLVFGFIRGARYVPEKNLVPLAEKLRVHRTAFAEAVDTFVAGYEQTKAEMLPVLEQALKDAARNAEAAASAFARLEAEYPTADAVRARFALRWDVYAIQGPRSAGAAAALEDESTAVRGVIREMVEQLRTEVAGKLGEVIALINKGGRLQPRSLEAAIAVLDHVDAVNVVGDEVLARQVLNLRRALAGINTDKRVSDDAVSGLENIRVALNADLDVAVAKAEQKLTGVGRRRLEVA